LFGLVGQFAVKAACAAGAELATAIPSPPTISAPIMAKNFLRIVANQQKYNT
jgi:hypothetical protein